MIVQLLLIRCLLYTMYGKYYALINAMPHLTSVGTWVGIVGSLPPVWSPTRGGLEGICVDHNAHASKPRC